MKVRVYALVGRSGTGKSFRAQSVAAKHRIPIIIDDGLIIRNEKILAGRSAKQEKNFLAAVKCALFEDLNHYNQAMEVLNRERYHKVLILGTSEKMTAKIAARLGFDEPSYVIHIEDIATPDEINTAMRVRYSEGQHVIPVPPLQIARSYPSIVYDSIRVLIRRHFKNTVSEKTLVKPLFSKHDTGTAISEAAIKQMVEHCLYGYENTMKVEKVKCLSEADGYSLEITVRTPVTMNRQQISELQEYISDSLEKYGGILINNVALSVENWT
ncbi:MAG: hypothetical protein MJ052_01560 [Sphaerochaetaceae bacterium]|nr:hypothetical protein [Sphaerochaetaceae bacterium]